MTEFEQHVLETLATLEERTSDLGEIRRDVADIRGKVRLLEFKASLAGTIAGGIVAGIAAAARAIAGK